jgi:hypothetical protein
VGRGTNTDFCFGNVEYVQYGRKGDGETGEEDKLLERDLSPITIHCRLYDKFHLKDWPSWWEWQTSRQPKIWNGRLVVRVWHLLRFTSNYTMKDFLGRDSYIEDVVRDVVCAYRQCNHRALVAALHDFVSQRRTGFVSKLDSWEEDTGRCTLCVSSWDISITAELTLHFQV